MSIELYRGSGEFYKTSVAFHGSLEAFRKQTFLNKYFSLCFFKKPHTHIKCFFAVVDKIGGIVV
jgi:hypothetical protein